MIESMRSEASRTYIQKEDLFENPDNSNKHTKRQCAQRTGTTLRFRLCFALIANRACLIFEKTFSTYLRFRIELPAVEYCERFLARVTLHTTSKSALLLISRYFVLEVILMLWAHAHCARHSVKTWAAFLTDSIMHALGVSEAIAVETIT